MKKNIQNSISINLNREKNQPNKQTTMLSLWFLFSFYCTVLQETLPASSPKDWWCCQSCLSCWYNCGGQGTAHVNRKGQQCLWWLQWHIPRIILHERNSDWVQKEMNFFFESEPRNPAVMECMHYARTVVLGILRTAWFCRTHSGFTG